LHLPLEQFTARDGAKYWLRIAISANPICIRRPIYSGSHWNIAMTFGTKKPEWCGYPMVKNFDDMTTRFDRIHKRDRWMDIGRAYA